MKTNNSVRMLGGIVAAVLVAASQVNATIVYQSSTSVGNQGQNGPWALGLDFTVNTPGYVTQIGAFDSSDNGAGFGAATIPLAIYDLGNSQIVPGTQVSFTGTAGTPIGAYRFQSIGSVLLSAGSYSIVAANYGSGGEQDYNAFVGNNEVWPDPGFINPLSFDNVGGALTMGNARFVSGYATLYLPPAQSSYFNPLFGAGSFDFTPVPEVGTFGAAAVGLLGLVYGARHVRNRRKKQGA